MRTYARITGWGKYLPERIMTNHDLEKMISTSDDWIRSRTGIGERRIAAEDESSSTMATEAALLALEMAEVLPNDLDLIIVSTSTGDMVFPACASLVQHAIGANRAGAFDVNAACSGFLCALATGSQFIASGVYRNVLIIGSDVYSRVLDWTDRNTCILFGDGAGAVVLQASDVPSGPLSFVMGSDGSGAVHVFAHSFFGAAGARPKKERPYLEMNGREVYRFAVKVVCDVTKSLVKDKGLELEDVDLFVFHQANDRIIRAAVKTLNIPMEKVLVNLDVYGNTSSASIPIALCDAVERGMLKDGNMVAMVAFGAGLSWAASIVQWGVKEAALSQTRQSIPDNVFP
ncbi:MAG: beta-ketoacyl-ACP synthase III [Dehalococcoidia bacterium]|nr:beta-ketoacyl-ACP synthase III [Dehalococcoidia bacterium]